MKTDYINYPKIIDEAMHSAVRNVLTIVDREGIYGEHHFFISFRTNFPGVKLSDRVKEKYPEEITIVLQYQFEELVVEESFFSLGLSFDSIFETVVVPYKAITSFTDAGAKFSLQFDYYANHFNEIDNLETSKEVVESESAPGSASSNVIVLDKFRKNKK